MLAVDKAEVLQQVIEMILEEEKNRVSDEPTLALHGILMEIEKMKKETDALAEQEAKQWAEDENNNKEEYANEQRRETSSERFTS